jgi:flagellar biosynthesis/type III secretory pathway protein FliH
VEFKKLLRRIEMEESSMTPSRKAVTAEELAKRVASLLNYEPRLADSNYAAVITEIAEQIKLAQEEGYQKGITLNVTPMVHEAYQKGFAEAREMAINTASSIHPRPNLTADEIVFRLKALRPEETGQDA